MTTIGVLEQARTSFAQRSWADAYMQFATADAATPLDLDDLERHALAASLSGFDEESTVAWTRALTTKPSGATIRGAVPGTLF